MTAENNFAVSCEAFTAAPFMSLEARENGYGIRVNTGAMRHAMAVASNVFTAVPLADIVKFSLNGTVLAGSRNASMKPMSVAIANIFIPIPHLMKRKKSVKSMKLAQPKIAVALLGDMPS